MPRLTTDQTIAGYRVVRLMGEGGMGAVYEVLDTTLDRRAALKVLHSDTASDPQLAARFLQEAKAASRVQHPGVVHVYEFGETDDGVVFFVMEYLDGESLSGRIRRADSSPAGRLGLSCLLLLQQVARALAAVHKLGFVHRDLKPGNVMLVPDSDVPGGERAKVLDFGIVKSVGSGDGSAPAPAAEIKTRTGLLMGTPPYMAPEQWRNQRLDGKADVYSLGIIAFEALTGRLPFVAEDLPAMGMQHCFSPVPSLAAIDPALPAELVTLVTSMLEKDPIKRPTVSEVADRLGGIIGPSLDSGSLSALQAVAPLSPEAKAALAAESPPLNVPGLESNAAASTDVGGGDAPQAPASPTNASLSSAAPSVGVIGPSEPHEVSAPAANAPVEVAAVPTAPIHPPASAPNKKATPTEPTLRPAPERKSPFLILLTFGILTAAGLGALLHDWKAKPTLALTDLSEPMDLRSFAAPMDLGTPPDLAQPADLARAVESPHLRPRSRCASRPADSCIVTHLTPMERESLQTALRDNGGIRICPGERLVIVGLPRKPRLLETPASLKGQALDLFLNTLRGLPPSGSFPVKVEIQCGPK